MAKEFKQWDKAFSADEIRKEQVDWLGSFEGSDLMHRVHFAAEIWVWSTSAIRQAVYLAADARQWQLFRVAMKGCTTYEKLFMLVTRRHFMISEHALGNIGDEVLQNEMCRIDNYIGALRRGGQLNEKFEVVK